MGSDFQAKMKRKRRDADDDDEDVDEIVGMKYGDGVAWYRGAMLGKGSFGSVYLANLKKPRSKYGCYPSLMAVKSAEVSVSGSIQKEMEVLSNVKGCPNIIRCFGEETTTGENGLMVYNILLEYGSGGTLVDRMKKSGSNGLNEFEVRCYTKSILKGVKFMHDTGFVHCDLKPDNIVLVSNKGSSTEFVAKIADFGLAKREKQCKKSKLDPYWRGTPMYLSPEVVTENVQKQPSDIWALGCIVLEMLTGKPPWDQELSADEMLKKIGEGNELPKIPNELSKEAKDFLKACFVRNSMYRFTAEMLLCHAFVEGSVFDTPEEEEVDDEEEDVEEEVDDEIDESILLVSEEDEWGSTSDDEFFCFYSEEEFEDDFEGVFSEDEALKPDQKRKGVVIRPTIGVGYDPTMQIPSNQTGQCQVNITIPAGV